MEHCKHKDPPSFSEEVMEGVKIISHNILSSCFPRPKAGGGPVLSIDCCLKGRVEWRHTDGRVCYLGENDLQISPDLDHEKCLHFPLGHYKGVTVQIDPLKAETGFKKHFPNMDIDIEDIYKKFSSCHDFFIVRSEDVIKHIMNEMYFSPLSFDSDYMKLKIAELFLFLKHCHTENGDQKTYFPKSIVNRVKMAKEKACLEDKGMSYTEAAKIAELPESVFRACFREIYGEPFASYMRSLRLEQAALELSGTDMSIADIALAARYDNPSKFSAAFRKKYGISPREYRIQASV